MTKRAQSAPAQITPSETALFLETTAQFHRLTGPPSFQRTIKEMVSRSDKVGTSAHVKREFEYVYGGFFKSVIYNVRRLQDFSRPRKFSGMWMDVHQLMPKHFPGGPSVLMSIGLTLTEKFANKPVAPTMLVNVLGGLRGRLLGGFLWGKFFFDKSSCGVWSESPACDCDPQPGAACKLKDICVTMREDFLAAANTLAHARREESKWLKDNIPLLEDAHGKALMQLLGDHPGHVGDLVIFWEAEEGWTILTRDLTFRILQKAHRKDEIKVYILRLPRRASGRKCTVLPEAAAQEVDGVLIDYNAQGARVRAPLGSVKKRQRVTIKARELGSNGATENSREGRVVYFDKADESVFAVRFPSK